MSKKAFTLIELLGVIIILGIIGVITVPIVLNIIERVNKESFKDSAYNLIKAGTLYYNEQDMLGNSLEEQEFILPNKELKVKGTIPKGYMLINEEGDIGIAIYNNKYCIKKGYTDSDIEIDENIKNCKLNEIQKLKYKNKIMKSNDECIMGESICSNGTKINVQVNDKEDYNFYVIKDDGKEVTLIMNKNLGNRVAWISKEDYIAAGGIESDYGSNGNNNKGPLTALKQLENLTKNWTNLKSYDYILEDDRPSKWIELGGPSEIMYQRVKRMNIKARLLMLTDIENIVDWETLKIPTYLYENLSQDNISDIHQSYWLSTAYYFGHSLIVSSKGNVFDNYVHYGASVGVRPVIKISKTI